MPTFTVTRRVAFSDTDMAGIVHFANFYRYLEEAEHAFFRQLGMRIIETQPDGRVIGWPRVRCSCSFTSPAYYEDLLDIHLSLTRIGVRSLTYGIRFQRGDTLIAQGDLKTVCCLCRPNHLESMDIPPEYLAKLEPWAAADA